jgi:hypothetical protein
MTEVQLHARASGSVIGTVVYAATLLACGPGSQTESEAETTSTETETGTETGTETDTTTDADDGEILDVGDDPDPDPQAEIVLALARGRGIVDGASSFFPPQHFPVESSLGLTALHDAGEGASYLAIWSGEIACLASVTTRGDVVELAWLDCIDAAWIWDAARMDADGDGVDELIVMKAGGMFEWYRLDPTSMTGLAAPIEIPSPVEWEPWSRPYGLITGPLDSVPGDEAIGSALDGDPAFGAIGSVQILHHTGQSLEATVIHGANGPPHLAELTGDGLRDLLIGTWIHLGTGDIDLVEQYLSLSTGSPNLWTMDAQGDGIADVARVEPSGINCMDPGVLELRTGPFEAEPPAMLVDGTHLDGTSAQLAGDLDHDGVDELVSLGVVAEDCPGPARWTLTTLAMGTTGDADLCDAEHDCAVVEYGFGNQNQYRYSLAAELVDADGDGNLDLAALLELQE